MLRTVLPQFASAPRRATPAPASARRLLFACLLLAACSGAAPLKAQIVIARAQDPASAAPDAPAPTSVPTPAPTPAPAPPNLSGDLAARINRARALAVVGQGVSAARELEAVRTALASDAANPARGVAGVLLMGLYLEQADYRRAQNLLRDAAAQRSAAANPAARDEAARTYYAVAGQLLNGLRSRLDRYRYYNVPVAGAELPAEVTSDVEGLRTLLDGLVQQAREANGGGSEAGGAQNASARADAAALFEDAVGMRLTLARTAQERQTWQRELADARQRLAAVEPRLQPSAATPARTPAVDTRAAAVTTANTNATANPVAAPARTPAASTSANEPARRDDTTRATNGGTAGDAAAPAATTTPNASTGASAGGAANTTPGAGAGAPLTGGLLDVGSLVDRATQRVAPSYPASARNARVGGVVTVYVVVNERGSVEDVSRASGPQLLRRAAEDAVRRWRFRPTVIDGQPVRVAGFVSFNFAL